MPENSNQNNDIEPSQSVDQEAFPQIKHTKGALGNLRRELTEKELLQSGARKLLLDNLDRLEKDVAELKPYKEKFHQADKKNEVLSEKLKANTVIDILYTFAMALGPLLISLYSSILLIWLIGLALMISAIIGKWARK